MFSFEQDSAIGRLVVRTDWAALVYYLRARRHPNPPPAFRRVDIIVNLGTLEEVQRIADRGDTNPDAMPRRVRVADSIFDVYRDRIEGIVPRESVHRGVVLEWLWYALAVCCAPDGWECFHASAVEREGTAAIFSGGSYSGKTTRALRAVEAGARFLSDDIVLLNAAGRVRGWDTTWHLQPDQARRVGGDNLPTCDFAGKVRVAPAAVAGAQEYRATEGLGDLVSHVGPGFDSAWIPRRERGNRLRVLFLNRQFAGSWFGGDQTQTFGYITGLRELGVQAAYYPVDYEDLATWDAVHLIHAGEKWVREAAARVKAAGLPLVVSAIVHGTPAHEDLAPVIDLADRVLCYSETERQFLLDRFPDDAPEKYAVVPMGIPAEMLDMPQAQATPSVLSATCYDESKRTLSLLRACIEADAPVTFCGPMDREETADYFGEMRQVAGDWRGVHFFGELHGDSLRHLFRKAHVYVDNAGMEPFGLSSLEALAAGCNLIHTQNSWAADLFGRYGTLVDPDDTAALAKAIKYELARPRGWHGFRPLTWEAAARALLPIYAELVGDAKMAVAATIPPRRVTLPTPPPELQEKISIGDFRAIGQFFLRRFIEAGMRPSDSILEMGCGVGRMAIPLAEGFLGENGRYEGFDILPEAIRWCQENIRDPRFRFTPADLWNRDYRPEGTGDAARFTFPYEEEAFDFVHAVSLFTHVLPEVHVRYIAEAARVLRPGGILYATYWLASRGPGWVPVDGYYTRHPDMSERAIGYMEADVRAVYERAGLIVVGPMAGTDETFSSQSVLIARKPEAQNATP